MKHFIFILGTLFSAACFADAYNILDEKRDRPIPVTTYLPVNAAECSDAHPCPVALLSSGYGVAHNEYSFIAHQLNQSGYLVIAIQHELPGDPPLAVTGNLFENRSENWQRGAVTLAVVRNALKDQHPGYDFDHLTLIGHSNGGDISAWLANENKPYISRLITLDHRRVPLPRTKDIDLLSIRGSDFPADAGVLPTDKEVQQFGGCVVTIPQSRHNDMTDNGPDWLKTAIAGVIDDHLSGKGCRQPAGA